LPPKLESHPFQDFRGVVSAMVTPFDDDDRLDVDRTHRLVEFLIDRGVAGIMVGGTTGEFVTMTTEERARCHREVIVAAAGRVPVIAHVGHVSLRQATLLATDARDAGADAVAAITPYYHATSEPAILAHLRRLAKVVADVPFFAYIYPGATGNPLSFASFQQLLDLPNLVGVKLSMGTMAEIGPFTDLIGDLCVMSGNDGLMRDFVARGGRAVVSGNATAYPEVAAHLLDALLDGRDDDARRYERAIGAAIELSRSGAPDRFKWLLAQRGVDAGRARVETSTTEEIDADTEAAHLAELEPLLAAAG
jgi:dihydrodipicolinate synthase/N-acetylneuraminate lyase